MDTLLPEDRIEACKMFYNNFHRLPRVNEKMNYKGIEFKIGLFVQRVKLGYYTEEFRHEVENIFGKQIKRSYDNVPNYIKLDACKTYFNQFCRLPSANDIITLENGVVFNIGRFVINLKNGIDKDLKMEVENIFGQKIYSKSRISIPNDKKIEACVKFFNEFGRIPYVNETVDVEVDHEIKVFKIGNFVHSVKNKRLIRELNNVFGIEINKKERLTDEEALDLIKEYKTLGIKTCVYKGFSIRHLISSIKRGNTHETIKNELIQFLNEFEQKKNSSIVDLIKRYFAIYKCMPSCNTVFENVNMYNLLTSILQGRCHKCIKQEVEEVVKGYYY